eukprot:scaffold1065_cov128-Skeletonema_marinoi.AAC.5
MIGNDEEVLALSARLTVLEASWIVRVSSCLVDALFLVGRPCGWILPFCRPFSFLRKIHLQVKMVKRHPSEKDTPHL